MFDWRCFVRLDRRVSNMFEAGTRTTLDQQLLSIVPSVFGQTTIACLVTKQCLMVVGRQTFPVCSGPNEYKLVWNHCSPVFHFNWHYRVPRPLFNNLLLNHSYRQKTSQTNWTFALQRPTFSTTLNNHHYKHLHGTAMRSPVSVVVAKNCDATRTSTTFPP